MDTSKICLFKGDKVIWMVFFLLCMVSVVEVFSASSVLTYKSQDYLKPISYHSFTVIVGVLMAIIVQNVPYKYFVRTTPYLLLFSFIRAGVLSLPISS